jgi:hypothetical protein
LAAAAGNAPVAGGTLLALVPGPLAVAAGAVVDAELFAAGFVAPGCAAEPVCARAVPASATAERAAASAA